MIGNRGSGALVSRLGCIEWSCLPYLDSPAHFCALHDEEEGGRFQIAPHGEFRSEQRYRQRTHVLETIFETPTGRAVLTDWMPLEGDGTSPVIHRRLEVLEGRLAIQVRCAPRFRYGADFARVERSRNAYLFRGDEPEEYARLYSSRPLDFSAGDEAAGRWEMESGEKLHLSWKWGRGAIPSDDYVPRSESPDSTIEAWREAAHRCPPEGCAFSGPWHDAVTRSDLLLQTLLAPYSGALSDSVAHFQPAVSAALRHRQSRITSVRDSALTIRSLAALGRWEQARRYFEFIMDIVLRDGAESLQANYSLDGGDCASDRELAGLRRFYLDVYGHVVLAATEYFNLFGELPARLWPRISEIADYLCQAWRRPDYGPSSDPRGRAEHHVVSKLYCWAALDRATRLSSSARLEGSPRWSAERDILHRTICQQGFDPERDCFVRAFGDPELDPEAVLIPLLGFLPWDDPRVQSTLTVLQGELSDGVFLYRHRGHESHTRSAESAHLPASLRFVSCLAASGRVDEASDRLAEICSYSTPLGFFGDRVAPASGEWSGAFPSASTSLELISATLAVAEAKGRKILLAPPASLTGRKTA